MGDMVLFYRDVLTPGGLKQSARIGRWLGPGLVIGHQGGNVWISFAGRCYLVANEHLRGLAPDEVHNLRPVVKEGLESLRKAAKSKDFIDLSRQQVDPSDILKAAALPAANDHEVDELPGAADSEKDEAIPSPSQPIEPEVELPGEHGPDIAEDVDLERADSARQTATSSAEGQVPASPSQHEHDVPENLKRPLVSWTPDGPDANLRWKQQRVESPDRDDETQAADVMIAQRQRGVMTAAMKKKLMDREVPIEQIPDKDRALYQDAEQKEWASWQKTGCVKVHSPKEAQDIRKVTSHSIIIRLRFVYRDKNSALRTPQMPLPVAAKARLCAQASHELLAKQGLIKLDSPTVHRVGVMIFLQLTVNLGWLDNWFKGDVTTAFLQGQDRDVASRGRLFLEPPSKSLGTFEGLPHGALLEVIKSVYGLPDAPRAWWE